MLKLCELRPLFRLAIPNYTNIKYFGCAWKSELQRSPWLHAMGLQIVGVCSFSSSTRLEHGFG
jgi:hypothetical protein